jgi:hypothetical protein
MLGHSDTRAALNSSIPPLFFPPRLLLSPMQAFLFLLGYAVLRYQLCGGGWMDGWMDAS